MIKSASPAARIGLRGLLAALVGLGVACVAPGLTSRAADLRTHVVPVTVSGAEGSGAGSATTGEPVIGFLQDIYLDYAGDATNTTDVTIAFFSRGGNLLVVSNNLTDGLYTPRAKPVDNANAAITDGHWLFPVWDRVTVTVAQASGTTGVTAYIRAFRP